jgi:hypothetical protein
MNGLGWSERPAAETLPGAGPAQEGGDVLFLPVLPFAVELSEALLFTPSSPGGSKNAGDDPGSGRPGGTPATPQRRVGVPTGSTRLAFSDQVSHAATAGQYQLERTFLLPVDAMTEPERSPLRVLERLKQRRLA